MPTSPLESTNSQKYCGEGGRRTEFTYPAQWGNVSENDVNLKCLFLFCFGVFFASIYIIWVVNLHISVLQLNI